MLSCEDCTIRVALDQGLQRLSTSPRRSNQVMTHSAIKSTEFAAYIGIDWADQKHDICLQEAGSKQIESLRLDHKPDSISNWVSELRQRFQGKSIAIALEKKRGALSQRKSHYGGRIIRTSTQSSDQPSSPAAPESSRLRAPRRLTAMQ